jgi:chitinase
MSKNEVLEEIYPDEVSDILKKASIERARQREKELTGHLYTLMAPVMPWLKGEDGLQEELIDGITSELKQIHEYLRGKGPEGQRKNETSDQDTLQQNNQQESQEDSFERLKKLQKVMAQTQTRKAR